jgi:hypothetical protein
LKGGKIRSKNGCGKIWNNSTHYYHILSLPFWGRIRELMAKLGRDAGVRLVEREAGNSREGQLPKWTSADDRQRNGRGLR